MTQPDQSRPDPPQHTIRVAMAGIVGDAPWANVLWVRNGSGAVPDSTELGTFLTFWAGQWDSNILTHLSTAVEFHTISAIYYLGGGEAFGVDETVSHFGNVPLEVLPANVSAVISWRVRARYRGGHPRTYLPGIPASKLATPRRWLEPFPSSIAQGANAFHSQINATAAGSLNDVHLGTVSFRHDNAWRNPAVFRDYTPTAAQCDARVDSQRRRLGPDL